MCNKIILENGGTLMSVLDFYKNQEMCDKAVDTHPFTIKYVPKCYKAQEMCYKAILRCFFLFDSIPDQYKAQEIREIVSCFFISFLIVYCPYKYITQKMSDKAVGDSLAALKLIPDWFVTNKMIKKLYTDLYAGDGLLFFDEDSGDVTFSCNEMGTLSVNLYNVNLDNNFDEDDLHAIILIRLLAWHSKFKKMQST